MDESQKLIVVVGISVCVMFFLGVLIYFTLYNVPNAPNAPNAPNDSLFQQIPVDSQGFECTQIDKLGKFSWIKKDPSRKEYKCLTKDSTYCVKYDTYKNCKDDTITGKLVNTTTCNETDWGFLCSELYGVPTYKWDKSNLGTWTQCDTALNGCPSPNYNHVFKKGKQEATKCIKEYGSSECKFPPKRDCVLTLSDAENATESVYCPIDAIFTSQQELVSKCIPLDDPGCSDPGRLYKKGIKTTRKKCIQGKYGGISECDDSKNQSFIKSESCESSEFICPDRIVDSSLLESGLGCVYNKNFDKNAIPNTHEAESCLKYYLNKNGVFVKQECGPEEGNCTMDIYCKKYGEQTLATIKDSDLKDNKESGMNCIRWRWSNRGAFGDNSRCSNADWVDSNWDIIKNKTLSEFGDGNSSYAEGLYFSSPYTTNTDGVYGKKCIIFNDVTTSYIGKYIYLKSNNTCIYPFDGLTTDDNCGTNKFFKWLVKDSTKGSIILSSTNSGSETALHVSTPIRTDSVISNKSTATTFSAKWRIYKDSVAGGHYINYVNSTYNSTLLYLAYSPIKGDGKSISGDSTRMVLSKDPYLWTI